MQFVHAAGSDPRRRLRWVFAALAIALVVLPLLADAPLLDPDEGLHAAIAQEMVLRHDYVTPTFLGEPFLDKPILFFWVEALSVRGFGMNEAAVRLPPLLFGTVGMASIALLGAALFGEAMGIIAAIVYATMVLPLAVSNVAVHDVALIPFMCLATFCLWRAAVASRAWTWGLAAGLCLGLSILTKGLVGVAFAGIFATCVAVWRPASRGRLIVTLAVAGFVAIAAAAPWYLAMEHAHPGYLHYYFIERHLEGYLTATQRHAGRPWWYYIPIVLAGTLPWTGYLPAALRSVAGDDPARGVRRVIWGWFTIGLVFLSIGESKLVTYALPLFPALALLIGEQVGRGAGWRASLGLGIFAIAVAVLPLVTVLATDRRLHAVAQVSWIGGGVACALVVALVVYAWRANSSDAFVMRAAMMFVVSFGAVQTVALPVAASAMTARDLARAINASGTLPPRVSVLDERIGSLVFYLSPALRGQATPRRIAPATLSEAIDHVRVDPPDAILAVRDDQQRRFQRVFGAPPTGVRAGTFTIYRTDRLRAALAADKR